MSACIWGVKPRLSTSSRHQRKKIVAEAFVYTSQNYTWVCLYHLSGKVFPRSGWWSFLTSRVHFPHSFFISKDALQSTTCLTNSFLILSSWYMFDIYLLLVYFCNGFYNGCYLISDWLGHAPVKYAMCSIWMSETKPTGLWEKEILLHLMKRLYPDWSSGIVHFEIKCVSVKMKTICPINMCLSLH